MATKINVMYVPSIWNYDIKSGELLCDHDNYEEEDGRVYCEQCDKEGLLVDDYVDGYPDGGYMSKAIDWEAFN